MFNVQQKHTYCKWTFFNEQLHEMNTKLSEITSSFNMWNSARWTSLASLTTPKKTFIRKLQTFHRICYNQYFANLKHCAQLWMDWRGDHFQRFMWQSAVSQKPRYVSTSDYHQKMNSGFTDESLEEKMGYLPIAWILKYEHCQKLCLIHAVFQLMHAVQNLKT
jgi:hypothetical protein